MFTINVSSNVRQWSREFQDKYRNQLPFATAKALTNTAQDIQREITRHLPDIFEKPTPFTQRAIGYQRATKRELTALVFVKDIQAAYLGLQVTGGERRPKRRALLLPAGVERNVYGNIPRTKLRTLLRRRDVFSGNVGGIGGIWQRKGRNLRLLIAYEPKAEYRKRFPFYEIARQVASRVLERNFRAAWAQAVATAK